MNNLQPIARYSRGAQIFHWITVILVLAAYAVSPGGREARVYNSASDFNRTLHESLGMLVMAVAILRLVWRAVDQRPPTPPMAAWMRVLAKIVQIALYILLFAVPLAAILGAWYEGHPVTAFGLGDIAPRLALNHNRGAYIARLHGTLGNAVLWVAGLHAAAALYHHIVLRDGVLVAMLPGLSPRRPSQR